MQFDNANFTINHELIGTFAIIAVTRIIKSVISFFIVVKFRTFLSAGYSPRFFLKV